MSGREEVERLADEIKQAMVEDGTQLVSYAWRAHDFENLRNLVDGNQVEALAVLRRVMMPLHELFTPGLMGAMVKNIRRQGVENAGALITRETVTEWNRMLDSINEYGRSMGAIQLSDDERSQEVLLMAFTDPEITSEVIGLVSERGLLPAETIRGLVAERKGKAQALREGAL
jgi:hypothetical protein